MVNVLEENACFSLNIITSSGDVVERETNFSKKKVFGAIV